jgi:predicted nucleotidyltransferase
MLCHDALPPLAGPLLDRLLTVAEHDERIVGVTAGGSAVTGTMDEFSDLDLIVVCRDGDDDAVLADVRGLAAAVGPLLVAFSGDHVGEPRLLIALYGPPLLHVDIKVIALRGLAHRVEDAHVLWERDGSVRDAMSTTGAVWPSPDGQWIEDRFWVWVHYGATKIGRGELFECLELLTLLRSAALGPLIAREHGQRPQGVRRVERHAPELVDALAATVGDHSREGCTAALGAAAQLYRALRARAADPTLERRADAEREALAFLDALA